MFNKSVMLECPFPYHALLQDQSSVPVAHSFFKLAEVALEVACDFATEAIWNAHCKLSFNDVRVGLYPAANPSVRAFAVHLAVVRPALLLADTVFDRTRLFELEVGVYLLISIFADCPKYVEPL